MPFSLSRQNAEMKWLQRVLADTGTLAGVDLIDKQAGVCPDPQFVLVFFEEAVDQDRKLVDLLNVQILVVACGRIEYLHVVMLESDVNAISRRRGI